METSIDEASTVVRTTPSWPDHSSTDDNNIVYSTPYKISMKNNPCPITFNLWKMSHRTLQCPLAHAYLLIETQGYATKNLLLFLYFLQLNSSKLKAKLSYMHFTTTKCTHDHSHRTFLPGANKTIHMIVYCAEMG